MDFTQEIPEIVFMNGRDIEIGEPYITPDYFEIRVRGDFATQLDFEKFPFEKHELYFLTKFYDPLIRFVSLNTIWIRTSHRTS